MQSTHITKCKYDLFVFMFHIRAVFFPVISVLQLYCFCRLLVKAKAVVDHLTGRATRYQK